MTAAFNKILAHFNGWREWELNPIVLKELRQAVRSRAVTVMLLLLLTGLFLISVLFLVTQSFDVNPNEQLGGSMFSAFMVMLAFASILFIPLYTGIRVAVERQDNNPDLLYISTLSPARIIRGKFLCGAYLALLFFSAVMPFMAFTNLLRGVDLPTIFFILFCLFTVVCVMNQLAIFFACLPMSRPFKILLALYGFFQCFALIMSAVAISFDMIRSGVGEMMSEPNFWLGTLTGAGICAAITGLFFVLSVALVSPPSANRAWPVRAYITVIWVLSGFAALWWTVRSSSPTPIFTWANTTFGLMICSLLVVISNADQLSVRIRRGIPQGLVKRAVSLLLSNGAAGGLIWVAALCLVTYFVTQLTVVTLGPLGALTSSPRGLVRPLPFSSLMYFTSGTGNDVYFFNWATILAYVFDYALTGLFIHRKFLSRRSPKLAGLLAVLLAALWALAPSIVFFFLNRLNWDSIDQLQLGNMFNLFALRDQSKAYEHFFFAFGWLIVAVLFNAPWFRNQLKNFRPYVKTEAPPVLDGTLSPPAAG